MCVWFVLQEQKSIKPQCAPQVLDDRQKDPPAHSVHRGITDRDNPTYAFISSEAST